MANIITFKAATEVRAFMASRNFTKVGNVNNCQGRWADKSGATLRVGMGLAKTFRHGQSSQGNAPWVYTVAVL